MGNLFDANKEPAWTKESLKRFAKEMQILTERDRQLDEVALGKPPQYQNLRGINGFLPIDVIVNSKVVGNPIIIFDEDINYQYIELGKFFSSDSYIQLYLDDKYCHISFENFSSVKQFQVEFFIDQKLVFLLDGNKENRARMKMALYERFNYIKITKR